MMSTAILMSMGAEQSTKHPVAQEVEKLDGPTFAQALDARVGTSSETVVKDPAAEAPPELGNAKTEATAKNLVRVPELMAGTKARSLDAPRGSFAVIGEKDPAAGTLPIKTESIARNLIDVPELTAGAKTNISAAGQTIPNGSESKEIAAGKTKSSQTETTREPQVSWKTEDSGTQVAEPPGKTEQITAEALTSLPVASTSGTQTGEADSVEGHRDENQILETPVSSKGVAATGTAPETTNAKKTIKTQGSDATQTIATKSGATAIHAMTDEAKLPQGVVVEGPITLAGQTLAYVAPVAAPTISRSAEGGGAASGAPLITGASSTADGSSHKNLVQSAKTPASNLETTPAVLGDSTGTAKTDAKAERSPAVASNAVGDSDVKGQTAGESPVALVHPVASGSDLTSGTGPSGVTGLVKLPNGEPAAQTAGLPTGVREQDGSGATARSFETMPRTLSATPTALEVGIPDGTHGWLKVRAEMTDGGVVNASVSAASSASQEMLHRELPSLTAYLQSEKVAVNTVVVHPTASTGAESRGHPTGTESGSSGQTPQRSNEGGEQGQGSLKATAEAAEDVAGYQGLHGISEDGTLPLATYSDGGSWLSVRA
jgi:hypothetical protein